MLIGSLFSGIGGLDLACEAVFPQAKTVWQLDLVGAEVRRRHWPSAVQHTRDISGVQAWELAPVDVLCGGFPCQDLSQAGNQAGLEGKQSGLYRHLIRLASGLEPRYLIIENTPALLSNHKNAFETHLRAVGYSVAWVRIEAATVGAPHKRSRVFVVATKSSAKARVIDMRKRLPDGLWPTPTAGDAKSSGSRCKEGSGAHAGTSLTDAVRPDRTRAGEGATANTAGLRLNPDWVESLMGYPVGWTTAGGSVGLFKSRRTVSLHGEALRPPVWPRGRAPRGYRGAWPGFDGEPPRALPLNHGIEDKSRRLRYCGNAVVPQQGAAAIRAALGVLDVD